VKDPAGVLFFDQCIEPGGKFSERGASKLGSLVAAEEPTGVDPRCEVWRSPVSQYLRWDITETGLRPAYFGPGLTCPECVVKGQSDLAALAVWGL
jgi:hypothetical protein